MLRDDVKWPDDRQYMSKTEWEPIGFFAECLCNSKHFDLMLGFFSSSAIELLSCGFAAFIYNGGKMRLIVNDILSQQDKMAVELGCHSLVGNVFDLTDLPRLKQTLSKRDTHFFECLSYLIQVGRIEVKIISPKGRSGISHTKMGMFGDALNKVAFAGSCNFSYSAFIENIEQLSVFCDWDGVLEKKRINAINSRFENAFNGLDNSLNIIEPSDVRTCLAQEFGGKDIAQLLEDESKLIGEKLAETDNLSDTVSSVLKKMQIRVDSYIEQISDHDLDIKLSEGHPHFPYTTGPRPYQVKAFENWKANGQKGLFGMATGTGKTITALNCLLEIYNRFGYYKAIIIVPTISLVSQWEHECFNFGFSNVIKVFSKNDSWKESVASLRFQEKFYGSDNSLSYVIITTYASFAKEATATLLSEFPKNKLLLIADEAHNMGAASLKKLMPRIQYLRKIGLSATPERQFDEVGNKSICQFFGVEGSEYTYTYSMKDAIENGALCRYYYYPHIVHLDAEEMNRYSELSLQIAKYFSANDNCFVGKDPILTALLLKRKRIIHRATGKKEVFREIVQKRFEQYGNLKYTLIYVPEGNKTDDEMADVFANTDMIRNDDVSERLIDQYSQIICDVAPLVTVKKFTAESVGREEMLHDFASGELEVLTSMKCLDEGIDIPRSEMAIFCASTGNPRQFIQRRGRILRPHKDKKFAVIHDLIVAPKLNPQSDSFCMERSMLVNELKRVNDFALLSENPSDTCLALKDIMNYYKISLFNTDTL